MAFAIRRDLPFLGIYPGAWLRCGFALVVFVVLALDYAGMVRAGALPLLLLPALLLVILTEVAWLPSRVKRHGWRSVLPLLLLLAAFPSAAKLSGLLLRWRFELNRERYEALAAQAFAHPERFGFGKAGLESGYSARPVRRIGREPASEKNPVVAVDFIVVSHGFAGHTGFLRFFDADAERRTLNGENPPGWRGGRRLAGSWFIVAN